MSLYTIGQSADYAPAQDNPRFLYDGTFSHVASTYTDHPSRGSRWTGNADYYADWLAGLGEGEGIRSFNIWITTPDYLGATGNPYSRIDYGQELFCGTNSLSIWTGGTASGDWHAAAVLVYSNATWGASYGVQWTTTNPVAFLRPGGMDLGLFSFTLDDVWTGSDPLSPEQISPGQSYRVFFGSTAPIFDDQGWGTTSGSGAFTNRPGNQWQGEMRVTAQVVPEPNVVGLLGLGALITLLRRFRNTRR